MKKEKETKAGKEGKERSDKKREDQTGKRKGKKKEN